MELIDLSGFLLEGGSSELGDLLLADQALEELRDYLEARGLMKFFSQFIIWIVVSVRKSQMRMLSCRRRRGCKKGGSFQIISSNLSRGLFFWSLLLRRFAMARARGLLIF